MSFVQRFLGMFLVCAFLTPISFAYSETVDEAERRLLESATNEQRNLLVFAIQHSALSRASDTTYWAKDLPPSVLEAAKNLAPGGRTDVRLNQSIVTLVSDGHVVTFRIDVTVSWECGSSEQRKTCSRITPDPTAVQADIVIDSQLHGYLFTVSGEGKERSAKIAALAVGCRGEYMETCLKHGLMSWASVAKAITPMWGVMDEAGTDGVLTRDQVKAWYEQKSQLLKQMSIASGQTTGLIKRINGQFKLVAPPVTTADP